MFFKVCFLKSNTAAGGGDAPLHHSAALMTHVPRCSFPFLSHRDKAMGNRPPQREEESALRSEPVPEGKIRICVAVRIRKFELKSSISPGSISQCSFVASLAPFSRHLISLLTAVVRISWLQKLLNCTLKNTVCFWNRRPLCCALFLIRDRDFRLTSFRIFLFSSPSLA